MHYRFLRDSFYGRLVYHLSGQKLFQHKEDKAGYIAPPEYLGELTIQKEDGSEEHGNTINEQDLSQETKTNGSFNSDGETSSSGSSATVREDGYIVVDWDGPDDEENPYNWTILQKAFLIFEISFLTTSVYMASAVYTPGIDQLMSDFHIGRVVATLPLTLFVLGYSLGPMIFSPFSENAAFGRTSIYIVTLFFFFILQIPTALVDNIAGLCILRFLSGFFASPCLATGGASIGDIVNIPYMPLGLALWSIGAVCGPSLGPFFGSILVERKGWRWCFWFMAITSGFSLTSLFFFFPETYQKTLLRRKAMRLRKVTGNDNIYSEGEIENMNLNLKVLVKNTLWRPFEIIIFEPVVLLINVYIALVYSILYLWFEAFPLVYSEVYHFPIIESGVTYISLIVGVLIAAAVYLMVCYKIFTKKILDGTGVTPEVFIPIAIAGGVCMPVGLLIFAWTSNAKVHWIGSLIGSAIFAAGAFSIFQSLFNYLGMSFNKYLASVFAGNALFRSAVASVFPLFGHALFVNLSSDGYIVGWGTTLLAFLCIAMIAIPVLFYLNGPKLRARSRYAS